jgi:hypothetical protein
VNSTLHLHLHGHIFPLPHVPSLAWYLVKHKYNLTFIISMKNVLFPVLVDMQKVTVKVKFSLYI